MKIILLIAISTILLAVEGQSLNITSGPVVIQVVYNAFCPSCGSLLKKLNAAVNTFNDTSILKVNTTNQKFYSPKPSSGSFNSIWKYNWGSKSRWNLELYVWSGRFGLPGEHGPVLHYVLWGHAGNKVSSYLILLWIFWKLSFWKSLTLEWIFLQILLSSNEQE